MKWGNCWVYALMRWIKNPKGTYLIVRLTRDTWFPVPHVMFAKTIENTIVSEFKPSHWTKKHFIRGWWVLKLPIYTLFFHGRIRTGLGEENKKDVN